MVLSPVQRQTFQRPTLEPKNRRSPSQDHGTPSKSESRLPGRQGNHGWQGSPQRLSSGEKSRLWTRCCGARFIFLTALITVLVIQTAVNRRALGLLLLLRFGSPTRQHAVARHVPGPAGDEVFRYWVYDDAVKSLEKYVHENRKPVFEGTTAIIDFGSSTPFPIRHVLDEQLCASFQGTFLFREGQYRFAMQSSRAVRIYVDDDCLFDEWFPQTQTLDNIKLLKMTAGKHLINVDFCSFRVAPSPDKQPSSTHISHTLSLNLKWLQDDFGLMVYVYDLPPRFNTKMVQANDKCRTGMFAPEYAIHQGLLSSNVRTLDPLVADVFYVPVYTACNFREGKTLMEEAITYINRYDFFRRRQGQDHALAATYDYGACFQYEHDKAAEAGVVQRGEASTQARHKRVFPRPYLLEATERLRDQQVQPRCTQSHQRVLRKRSIFQH